VITSSAVLQSAPLDRPALVARVAHLEAALARTQTTLAQVTAERDKLRRAYEQLKEQVELLRRRIYIAKAERVDVTQLEMEFAETQAKLDALAKQLNDQAAPPAATDAASDPADRSPSAKPRPKPTGRRNLADEDLPEERVEILDPALEGQAERLGFEQSFKLRYRRGGHVRVVVARATYKTQAPADAARPDAQPMFELVTAPMPKELFPRGLLAPSMIAHVLVQKYRWGLPFHRQARMSAAEGFRLDDGMMCRYAEDAGATLGCIVEAMAKEAKDTAFCLSTDATGVCIQPEPLASRKRQACRKGHFFVVLADQDHVFFEFQPRHTSAAVCAMFRGFSGYIQADAHAIYDAIFRGEARASADDKPPLEVACWSHCRRKAWEAAAVAKDPAAREALLRMH
jgi:transposase